MAAMCVVFACKTKKAIVAVPKTPAAVAVDARKAETFKLLRNNDFIFNTLSLRAKAFMDINGNTNNVSMNIRMEKDQKIWVSITAIAGIEVARALITPDSIKVRNNFQSVYLKKPFSYIQRFAGKQVDFQLLQAIFSGNTIATFMQDSASLTEEGGVWVVSGGQQDLSFRMLFNTLLKISEDNLNDLRTGNALKVQYGEYQRVNDLLFPSTVKVSSAAGRQKIMMDLDFSKVERNVPLEFPFTVPKKYEVIN